MDGDCSLFLLRRCYEVGYCFRLVFLVLVFVHQCHCVVYIFSARASVHDNSHNRDEYRLNNPSIGPQGFNCSCFAYGHTGSGKTYSMFGCTDKTSLPGAHEALAAPPEGEAFGLVPRICYSLLHRLQEASSGTCLIHQHAN